MAQFPAHCLWGDKLPIQLTDHTPASNKHQIADRGGATGVWSLVSSEPREACYGSAAVTVLRNVSDPFFLFVHFSLKSASRTFEAWPRLPSATQIAPLWSKSAPVFSEGRGQDTTGLLSESIGRGRPLQDDIGPEQLGAILRGFRSYRFSRTGKIPVVPLSICRLYPPRGLLYLGTERSIVERKSIVRRSVAMGPHLDRLALESKIYRKSGSPKY
jgi:hypothetical protein